MTDGLGSPGVLLVKGYLLSVGADSAHMAHLMRDSLLQLLTLRRVDPPTVSLVYPGRL